MKQDCGDAGLHCRQPWNRFCVGNPDTIEQIGTESDNNFGYPEYYAWYEFYPKNRVEIPIEIQPGDKISAEVKQRETKPNEL